MNEETNLRARVDALWEELETHYRPTLTDADLATLRSLDDDAVDGVLTEARFNRVKAKLMKDRRRSYEVDHSTGRVDPAFWSATDEKGKTNLQHRKSIHGMKGITRKGRKFVVTVGTGSTKVVREFDKAADAHLYRDAEIEARATVKQWYKNQARDLTHEEEQIKRLTDAKVEAEARKKALREYQASHPEMPWSKILHLPQFDNHAAL